MLNNLEECIGISENRLHHSLGVARKCYQISVNEGHNEDFCRKMFLLGWLHDIGYEFAQEKREHPKISAEMVSLLGTVEQASIDAIKGHGKIPAKPVSDERRILIAADMMTDSRGNDVSVTTRLEDIRDRYGDQSEEYLTACDVCYVTGLTEINMAGII